MYPQRVLLQDYPPLAIFVLSVTGFQSAQERSRSLATRTQFLLSSMSLLSDLEQSQMSVAVPGWRNQLDSARLLSSLPLCRLASPPQ